MVEEPLSSSCCFTDLYGCTSFVFIRITCHPNDEWTGFEISPGCICMTASANGGVYVDATAEPRLPEFCLTLGSIETCFARSRKSCSVAPGAVTCA